MELIFWLFTFFFSLTLMALSSDRAVEHSIALASKLGVPSVVIGFVLVSLGTDLPEIANSIISCQMGHATINLGDSLGSIVAQLTLVPFLLVIFGKSVRIKKKEVSIMGSCLLLSLFLLFAIVAKGRITRLDALFLVLSWVIYTMIAKETLDRRAIKIRQEGSLKHLALSMFFFSIVSISAYLTVTSVIMLSKILHVSELLLSFFVLSIGTSLPELFVELMALRRREYGIVIGDIVGSCVVDASFAIGIGPLIFPQAIPAEPVEKAVLVTVLVSFGSLLLMGGRERIDRKALPFLLFLYLLPYFLLMPTATR